MGERVKGEILHVGTVDAAGTVSGWIIDGHGRGIGLEVVDGVAYHGGYTTEELRVIYVASLEARLRAAEEALSPFSRPRATERMGEEARPEDDVMKVEVTAGDWMRACFVLGRMDAAYLRALPAHVRPSDEFIASLEALATASGEGEAGERMTHGRHCPCSACAREDWTRPDLGPCGMHGPECPPVYAPLDRAEPPGVVLSDEIRKEAEFVLQTREGALTQEGWSLAAKALARALLDRKGST